MIVNTFVDDICNTWDLDGDMHNPNVENKPSERAKKLFSALGPKGWIAVENPQYLKERVVAKFNEILCQHRIFLDSITEYHNHVDSIMHGLVISKSRDLRLSDFELDLDEIANYFGNFVGINLTNTIDGLNRDHVQLRIVRPNALDFNPPHRDSYLPYYENVMNVWIPIECEAESIMPVCSGSHLWNEEDIIRTSSDSAKIGNNLYRVPAVIKYKGADLKMERPVLEDNGCMIFTPYLVHGFGINQSNKTRFALELRFGIC